MVSPYNACTHLHLTICITAKLLLKKGASGELVMFEPLAWWYRQRSSGHERDGMTQMAIDVLSTPGKCLMSIPT